MSAVTQFAPDYAIHPGEIIEARGMKKSDFSFFHEAGHILKHSKKALYLDDTNSVTDISESRPA
jgi:hypothetical protein